MDKKEATEIANKLLDWYGKPEEEKWSGFTAVIATYGNPDDEPDTMLTREAALSLFNQLAEKKLPATVNGVRFRMKSIELIEETSNAGRIIAEYVREE